jgi:hypothetical protein
MSHDPYALDYLQHHLQNEQLYIKNYPIQTQVFSLEQRRHRKIAIQWLLEVAVEFYLNRETVHLAVHYMDRYWTQNLDMPQSQLQLLAITALLLASKFEEIYAPLVSDMSYITNHTFTIDEIKEMEPLIMHSLGYRLSVTTVLNLVNFWLDFYKIDSAVSEWARYYAHLTLILAKRYDHPPSEWAKACISLTIRKWGQTFNPFTPNLELENKLDSIRETNSCWKAYIPKSEPNDDMTLSEPNSPVKQKINKKSL